MNEKLFELQGKWDICYFYQWTNSYIKETHWENFESLGKKYLTILNEPLQVKGKKKLFHWKPIMISQDMRREGIFLDFITYENV